MKPASFALFIAALLWSFTALARSPESDLAAPGAALYETAVKESVQNLAAKKQQPGAQRPPSPGPDYYWCENCKTYHKQQIPAHAQAQKSAAAPAQPQPSGTTPADRPPAPGPDHYWCENCKTYHKRPASPQQPAAHDPDAAAASPQKTGVKVPPPPGPDYFWCNKCGKYHKKQDPSGTPVVHHTPGESAAESGLPPGPDYYYCEKCKTYHRRQDIQADSSHLLEAMTNSPTPGLFSPAGSKP